MKLLICDKDGTLTEPMTGKTFPDSPTDQKLIPRVADILKLYRQTGWTIAIATNQGGVAAGYKSLNEAIDELKFCLSLCYPCVSLGLLCPDAGNICWGVAAEGGPRETWRSPNWQHWQIPYKLQYRKPGPGMLIAAKELLNPFSNEGFEQVLFVGDQNTDQESAAAAGVNFMWSDQWLQQSIAA
jgi:D-glycero-D-manno-heptose 1,7-bisphosphate phosphatase